MVPEGHYYSDRDRYFITINFRTIIGLESNRRVRDACDSGSVSDLIAFLPENAERVVTSTSSTASSPLDRIEWCAHEVIAPWPHMPNLYSVGSGYRTSRTNCDDPVHGSDPGETASAT